MKQEYIKYTWKNNSTETGDTGGVLYLSYPSGSCNKEIKCKDFHEAAILVDWINSAIGESLKRYKSDLANKFSDEAMEYHGRY